MNFSFEWLKHRNPIKPNLRTLLWPRPKKGGNHRNRCEKNNCKGPDNIGEIVGERMTVKQKYCKKFIEAK